VRPATLPFPIAAGRERRDLPYPITALRYE
jgi:hypothetical protein